MPVEIYQENPGYLIVDNIEFPLLTTTWAYTLRSTQYYISIISNNTVIANHVPLRHITDNNGAKYETIEEWILWWNMLLLTSSGTSNITEFGAIGDGITDDTVAIQNALNSAGKIFIPSGTYITLPLTVNSNTVIEFSPDAIFLAKTGYIWSDRLLNLTGVNNVRILGNGGTIQMLKSEYSTGEDRHCINISGCEDIYIENLTVKDSGGDGIYIGGAEDSPSRNITIFNCVADNNRRQGMSITNVKDCWVIGGIYKNTSGTAPQSGIDIEPNNLSGYFIENVNLIGVKTYNNKGYGILMAPSGTINPTNINVIDCTSESDGGHNTSALGIVALNMGANKVSGTITVNNMRLINPSSSGLLVSGWNQNSPHLTINNLYILNPSNDPEVSARTIYNRSGIYFYYDAVNVNTEYVGNFNVNGVKIEDNRDPLVMYSPILIYNHSTYPTKNIKINNIDLTGKQWTNTSVSPIYYSDTNNWSNIKLDYINDIIFESVSYTLSKLHIGLKLTTITTGKFTLPLASTVDGCEYEAFQKNEGNVQFYPNIEDKFLGYTNNGVGMTTREVGSRLRVKSKDGDWEVVYITGSWGIGSNYGERTPLSAASAAPTTGTWIQGDKVWNKYTPAGSYIGWVCTEPGTPGTWKGFGLVQS